MAKRSTLTTADRLERWALLLASQLTVRLGRLIASHVDPKQSFVLQHGDIKFVPWEGRPPRRLARRRLAQEADRAADSDQVGMINVRDGGRADGPHGVLTQRFDGWHRVALPVQTFRPDLLHGAHRQPTMAVAPRDQRNR